MKPVHVPDVPAPKGVCWKQGPLLHRCRYPEGHDGPHEWEFPSKHAIVDEVTRNPRMTDFVQPDPVTKRCSRCGITKPLDGYYASKRSKDGKQSECKACRYASNRAWEVRNAAKRRAMNAKNRAANSHLIPATRREYYLTHRAEIRERQRQTRAADRRKEVARCRARRAVRSGRLLRPESCQRCGRVGRVEISHDDYDKPLQVEFLCIICHHRKDRDAKERAA